MARGRARSDLDRTAWSAEDYEAWINEWFVGVCEHVDDPDELGALLAWGRSLIHDLTMADGVRHGRVRVTYENGEVVFDPRPIP